MDTYYDTNKISQAREPGHGKPESYHPWPDSPPYFPQSRNSANSSHSRRPSSRTSSFGSIDSGVSHPPRAASHRTSRKGKKELNIAWNTFDDLETVGDLDIGDPLRGEVDDLDNGFDNFQRSRRRSCSPPVTQRATGRIMHKEQLPEIRSINRSADDVDFADASIDYKSAAWFACPFYKRFPVCHLECTFHDLRSIREVRQHILRQHTQKYFHCSICFERFSSPRPRDDHVRSQDCQRRNYSLDFCIDGDSITGRRPSRPETPELTEYAEDDTAFATNPSRQVDYLSHNWREEDIWTSWRYVIAHRGELVSSARLENASWRTWMKVKNNLKTISPESINWLKNCDVIWLYGPLQGRPRHICGTQTEPWLPRYSMDRKLSPAEQWYSFWDILFANMPRPRTPYLSKAERRIFKIMSRDLRWHKVTKIISEYLTGTTALSAVDKAVQRAINKSFAKLEELKEQNTGEVVQSLNRALLIELWLLEQKTIF
ncbi:hypothetical protein NQ176_g6626 [Zarea fungicola]|uniref:Uncharacterized protein n=1 Tax=Zarea fungicola TaxID=93591 RepID=A0ACC1N2D5_9HYPO|nr:hypothetical protein NQ176_g6626 [Lecanicillium fungicola]